MQVVGSDRSDGLHSVLALSAFVVDDIHMVLRKCFEGGLCELFAHCALLYHLPWSCLESLVSSLQNWWAIMHVLVFDELFPFGRVKLPESSKDAKIWKTQMCLQLDLAKRKGCAYGAVSVPFFPVCCYLSVFSCVFCIFLYRGRPSWNSSESYVSITRSICWNMLTRAVTDVLLVYTHSEPGLNR